MLNYIWLVLILLAVLWGGFSGRMEPTVSGAVEGAESAVKLALGLIGIMALWLGIMRLADKAGLVQAVARRLRPLLTRLFPDVPPQHPAMGSMVMNIAANMLGLNNAATPLGLRAMKDLESLNRQAGTATNAMCTFLAINTGSVQLIPMTAVAVLAAAGSQNPTAIIGTAFLASVCTTTTGLVAAKTLERLRPFRLTQPASSAEPAQPPGGTQGPDQGTTPAGDTSQPVVPISAWGWAILVLFAACFGWFFLRLGFPELLGATPPETPGFDRALVRCVRALSLLAIPLLVSFIPLYAALRRIPVYEELVEGAKEGFQVAVRIIPFLVAMLVAIGMFRGAGGIDLVTQGLRPVLDWVHFPAELVPMSLIRPLSGSGTLAVLNDLVQAHGPDNILSRMAATLFGSTETTFYVLVVYFGSVGIRRTRHAVLAGLMADAAGVIASVVICRLVFP